ncbi:MAG: hypothetical protein Q9214_000381 [Letrouitia sp. 1 TL-2023]
MILPYFPPAYLVTRPLEPPVPLYPGKIREVSGLREAGRFRIPYRFVAASTKVTDKAIKVKHGLKSYVNGAELSVLADTGANDNVMSASYASEKNFTIDRSDTRKFLLGNSKTIESIGTVNIDSKFKEEPLKVFKIKCHVLQNCVYDLILGTPFLSATKAMSKYCHRLTKCAFKVAHLGYMGSRRLRLRGFLDDLCPVLALPDSGAECNVIDYRYAKQHNFNILSGPEHCGYLRFADGSVQETVGQVSTVWTFSSGERIPIVFEVLEKCCSDLIIGDDILRENDVFRAHADSITANDNTVDHFHLAPFGYEQGWQKMFTNLKSKFKNQSATGTPTAFPLRQEEEQRRRDWNHAYGFDGALASAEERSAEQARRNQYDVARRQQAPKSVPSIPSVPNSAPSSSRHKPIQGRDSSALRRPP